MTSVLQLPKTAKEIIFKAGPLQRSDQSAEYSKGTACYKWESSLLRNSAAYPKSGLADCDGKCL